jgi:hypothetical protein
MADFQPFAKLVNQQFVKLSSTHDELFAVELPDIFDLYISLFPDGTNPIFRERTEHDCNCCKQFIRNIGKVVAIKGGKIITVWDVEGLEYPYDVVAKSLGDAVRSAAISSVFRTKESSYSNEKNFDNHDSSITWHHFHAKVPGKFVTPQPGDIKGKFSSTFQVFRRGLNEIRQEDLETVLDLIKDNSLYRGKEFEKSVEEFKSVQKQFIKGGSTDAFVWENVRKGCAGFRNTVIGTLLVDLASGDDLEVAVKKFETKLNPGNYKRPKALVTPRMIEDAVSKLRDLDLEDAIHRRLATVEDLSVNDVLFVDNSVVGQMKDGLTDLLMSSPSVKKSGKVPKTPQPIRIEDFISLGSKSIQLVLDNKHMGNFATLTAPVHENIRNLFKWKNSFGWSYDGDVADTMRELVVSRGGRVDGVFRFTHQWNYAKRNASLMDLHVFMPGSSHRDGCHDDYPSGRRVGWNRRNDLQSGGVQDVDYTQAAPEGYVPIENITFPDLGKMPEGTYVCKIHNWNLRSPNQGGFKAEIEFNGQVFEYEVDRPLKNKEWVTVAEVTLSKGKFTIEHKLPTTSSSKEKWGIPTQVPVKVQTVLLSPNHWENAGGVGNKHWFFILDGCRVDEPVRGIYNEFLVGDLEPHRKVFEILGSKTKCPPTDKQLSGVGFSETRSDKVVAIADGRPYEILF